MKVIIGNISYIFNSLTYSDVDDYDNLAIQRSNTEVASDSGSYFSSHIDLDRPLDKCGLDVLKYMGSFSASFWISALNKRVFSGTSRKLTALTNSNEVWVPVRGNGVGRICSRGRKPQIPFFILGEYEGNDCAREIAIGTRGAEPRAFNESELERALCELSMKAETFLNILYGKRTPDVAITISP